MIHKAVAFVRSVGLDVREGRPNQEPAFNPDSYVWVHKGVIYYDPEKFHVGDFLHEAGHVAVCPSIARSHATGDVEESIAHAIAEYLKFNQDGLFDHPEDPIARACLQAGDYEAIAWSYAAALACGVDPALVFENGFENEEARDSNFLGCQMGQHAGIAGLRAAGYFKHKRDYPRMERWLAP